MNIDGKHCEWCGQKTEKSLFRFVGDVHLTIFLNSPHIIGHDQIARRIKLSNGQILDYSAITSPTEAIGFKDLITHLFCSEKCEDEFVAEHAVVSRNDLYQKTPFVDWVSKGVFLPFVVDPKNIGHKKVECFVCCIQYPTATKTYTSFPLIGSKVMKGVYGKPPFSEQGIYPLIMSDLSDQHREGSYYLLNPDMNKGNKLSFCSNECAIQHAENSNCCVVYKNNILNGRICCLSVYTKSINEGLGNGYIFRPQPLQ
jgi:hypothetical protein